MALKFTSAQRKRLASVLMSDHETFDDAVDAVFALVSEFVTERASWVVVGQVTGTKERRSIPPSDPEAVKVALGVYSTEGDARNAATSLWFSTQSGDTFRAWWLPLFHGTPADMHKARKEQYQAAERKAKTQRQEKFQQQIEQYRQEAQERADAMRKEAV